MQNHPQKRCIAQEVSKQWQWPGNPKEQGKPNDAQWKVQVPSTLQRLSCGNKSHTTDKNGSTQMEAIIRHVLTLRDYKTSRNLLHVLSMPRSKEWNMDTCLQKYPNKLYNGSTSMVTIQGHKRWQVQLSNHLSPTSIKLWNTKVIQ